MATVPGFGPSLPAAVTTVTPANHADSTTPERRGAVVHEIDARDDRAREVGMIGDARVHERDDDPSSGRGAPGLPRADRLVADAWLALRPLVVLLVGGGRHDRVGCDEGHTRVTAQA